ncbi:hypothetical protein [Streptomyces thermoalcalitolerans]|uniref:Sialidase domain-containing protein n=1 Tax=Streptomyces thermoalcalitolerans TaxID=65605 RepID=A0ABN1NRX0_9ACTN
MAKRTNGRPLMTIRVSLDGGKTWGPVKVYKSSDRLAPMEVTSAWPPCRCPYHREKDDTLMKRLREVNRRSRRRTG